MDESATDRLVSPGCTCLQVAERQRYAGRLSFGTFRDKVVVPQLAEQRSKHEAGTNLVLIHNFEEIMNMANDQIPLIEEPTGLNLLRLLATMPSLVENGYVMACVR